MYGDSFGDNYYFSVSNNTAKKFFFAVCSFFFYFVMITRLLKQNYKHIRPLESNNNYST